jgi:hypothetical protein
MSHGVVFQLIPPYGGYVPSVCVYGCSSSHPLDFCLRLYFFVTVFALFLAWPSGKSIGIVAPTVAMLGSEVVF